MILFSYLKINLNKKENKYVLLLRLSIINLIDSTDCQLTASTHFTFFHTKIHKGNKMAEQIC